MAGLAAALNAPGCIDAVATALAARGGDSVLCRLVSATNDELELAVRAAMPAIPRVVSADAGTRERGEEPPTIAAFAVDGVASVSALDRGYAAYGPSGLVDEGEFPYAAILADAERGELVLARNGDGPGLYYARHGNGWLAASEPLALIRGGVTAAADVDVIRAFITTGACDDSERTFFARIRRVLPGEVVVLAGDGHAAVRQSTGWSRVDVATEAALQEAVVGSRLGLLLGPGLEGAAVLGFALGRPQRPHPLPVHTVNLDGIEGAAAHTPAVLVSLPHGTVRVSEHRAALDLDRYLHDVGEPLPDVGHYLMWAVARALTGEVDSLMDTSTGTAAGFERLADRLLAQYGVTVTVPLRETDATEDILGSIVGRNLPALAAQHAAEDSARVVTAAEVLLAHRDDVTAALVTPRPWSDPTTTVESLRRLAAGEPADADALLRAYLVERWIAVTGSSPAGSEAVEETTVEDDLDDVAISGALWRRIPVQVAALSAGDPLTENAAWAAVRVLTDTGEAEVLGGPWFAVLSGKAVAVSQRRLRSLLDVRPTGLARVLAGFARRRMPDLAEPWTAQVVIDHSGLSRAATAVLGRRRLRPGDAVYPPRPDAMPPADTAVVRSPLQPDAAAEALLDALRLSLPPGVYATLAGCAVASADAQGCRVLGLAPGPYADAVPDPVPLLAEALADNPAGQGSEQTPLVLIVPASRTPRPRRDYPTLNLATKPTPVTRPA